MMNMALKRLNEVPKTAERKVYVNEENNNAIAYIDGKFYSIRLIEGSSVSYYDDEKPIEGNFKEVNLPNIIEYYFGY